MRAPPSRVSAAADELGDPHRQQLHQRVDCDFVRSAVDDRSGADDVPAEPLGNDGDQLPELPDVVEGFAGDLRPGDGAAFLRALLAHPDPGAYQFVDESDESLAYLPGGPRERRITYYARVDETFTLDNPRGLVRRRQDAFEPPVDEVFARDRRWHPTEHLKLHWLGHNDVDHVEISEQRAGEIVRSWQAEWGPYDVRDRYPLTTFDALPLYFEYYNQTYRIEDGPDGRPDGRPAGYRLNLRTGTIDRDDEIMWDAIHPKTGSADIREIGKARYLELTEATRAHYLRGEGPVFALYAAVESVYGAAQAGSGRLSRRDRVLIRSLRRRTLALWEQECARRAGGAEPSFLCRSTLGSA